MIEQQREMHNNNKSANAKAGAANDKKMEEDNNINVFEKFPSLDIDTLLANPVAHMENKRFIDVDLNREFSMEKLQKVSPIDEEAIGEECDLRNEFCSDGNVDAAEMLSQLPHEAIRAREIESLLGPKFTTDSSSGDDAAHDDPNVCVVIDLHTTTANMGISLIGKLFLLFNSKTRHSKDVFFVLIFVSF